MKFLVGMSNTGIVSVYDTKNGQVSEVAYDGSLTTEVHGLLNGVNYAIFDKLGMKLCSCLELIDIRGVEAAFPFLQMTNDVFVFRNILTHEFMTIDKLISDSISASCVEWYEDEDRLDITTTDGQSRYKIINRETFDCCIGRLKFLSTLKVETNKVNLR